MFKALMLACALIFLPACASVRAAVRPAAAAKAPAPKSAPAPEHLAPAPICGPKEAACLPKGAIIGTITPLMALAFLGWLDRVTDEPRVDAIVLIINSPGGHFEAARAMVQALHEVEVPVHCAVRGYAASAAFWVLQACDRRVAVHASTLMTHQPTLHSTGPVSLSATKLREAAAELDALNNIIAETAAPRMKMTRKTYKARVAKGDWNMSAGQALEYGAVDEVVTSLNLYVKQLTARYAPQ